MGTLSATALALRMATPLAQVSMSTTRLAPKARGIHAPSASLTRLEARKTKSMTRMGMNRAATAGARHFHRRRATTAARQVEMNMVPVTATP